MSEIEDNNNTDSTQYDYDEPELETEKETVSKSEFITMECIDFLNNILKSLSHLMDFHEELDKEFHKNNEISFHLDSVFREIKPLHMFYTMANEKIEIMRNESQFCLTDLFLDTEVRASLKIYTAFLSQYATNAKWIGDFNRSNQTCQEVCERVLRSKQINEIVNLENCLYTIFNSLFAFELIFDRYGKCFDETNQSYQKAKDVKLLINDILKKSNTTQDQTNFFLTQSELALLTNQIKAVKINTRFIFKSPAIKFSAKDNKRLSRQLVLFSHCLYLTFPPRNISGTSSVCRELSLKSMVVSLIPEEEIRKSNMKWGLNINALEANNYFYFEDEQCLLTWQKKLQQVISNENMNINIRIDTRPTLGEICPEWQRDKSADYCNGLRCTNRFTSTMRRHHCRADGLLYCDDCSSFKLKLKFDKTPESRVCELCYRILEKDLQDSESLSEAKKQLNTVFERKIRKGIKINWLEVRVYNSDKNVFNSPIQYFCELDEEHPFLRLYKRVEDKIRHREIILLGMVVKTDNDSKYTKKLKPYQFIIEHQDKSEAYLFKASSPENCKEWVDCLRKSISNYCNKES